MPNFISRYVLPSSVTLGEGIDRLVLRFESATASISVDHVAEFERAQLRVDLEYEECGLEEASATGANLVARVIDALAFSTSASFWEHRLEQIVQWEPGTEEGEIHFYSQLGTLIAPDPILAREVGETAERVLETELSDFQRRSLHWYREGVAATSVEDKVLAFWLSLEILVGEEAEEREAQWCPSCKASLCCKCCEQVVTRARSASSRIRARLEEVVGAESKLSARASKARNTIVHQGVMKLFPNDSPQKLVEELGTATWLSLLNSVKKRWPLGDNVYFLKRGRFADERYRARVQTGTKLQFREGKPDIDALPSFSVKATRDAGATRLTLSTKANTRMDVLSLHTLGDYGGPK